MNEKPLERLNYYNGMPLNASDFKTEQEYHIRTRRWLNKSLYTAGIASGLEVRAITEGPFVAVGPGLALDSEGREIILLEEATVEVCSYAGTEGSDGTVVGNYLVIEYAEEAIAFERGGCAVRAAGTSTSQSTAPWGGPSRVEAKPKFSWVPFVPQPGSNQIVLARVELKHPGCNEVHQIDPGARRYVGAASAAMVRQYALEGEKEVAFIPREELLPPRAGESDTRHDVAERGRIYFHIRGRQPNSVTLYLKAGEMSLLNYTELGGHSHDIRASTRLEDHHIRQTDIGHKHLLSNVITGTEKDDDSFDGLAPHAHWIFAKIIGGVSGADALDNKNRFGIQLFLWGEAPQVLDNDVGSRFDANGNATGSIIFGGEHRHRLINVNDQNAPPKTEGPTEFNEIVLTHSNVQSGGWTLTAPGAALPARSGIPLSFVQDLQVSIGRVGEIVDRTTEIRQQLADRDPGNWLEQPGVPRTLGDGTSSHVLALTGTGPIRLDFLPSMSFVEGEYCIELSVKVRANNESNGGRVHYNLYIE